MKSPTESGPVKRIETGENIDGEVRSAIRDLAALDTESVSPGITAHAIEYVATKLDFIQSLGALGIAGGMTGRLAEVAIVIQQALAGHGDLSARNFVDSQSVSDLIDRIDSSSSTMLVAGLAVLVLGTVIKFAKKNRNS